MEYEIPAIVETKLTGYLGTAIRRVRGVEYRVRFTEQAGQIAGQPFRAGKPVDWAKLTVKMYHSGAKFFNSAATV